MACGAPWDRKTVGNRKRCNSSPFKRFSEAVGAIMCDNLAADESERVIGKRNMKHSLFTVSWALLLLASVMMTSGCGSGRQDKWTKDRPPVYPTSGQVFFNGQPVQGLTVTFQPVDASGRPGFAVTDREGKFQAQTFEPGDGLTAGKHRVAMQKTVMVDPQGQVVTGEINSDATGFTQKHLLPEKYADFTTSGLEVQIEAKKKNELPPFQLTEK